jgi:hypothetical protein
VLAGFMSKEQAMADSGAVRTRWTRWLWGGLAGLVARKGGIKHYLVYVLKQLRISGCSLPRR